MAVEKETERQDRAGGEFPRLNWCFVSARRKVFPYPITESDPRGKGKKNRERAKSNKRKRELLQ